MVGDRLPQDQRGTVTGDIPIFSASLIISCLLESPLGAF